MKNGRNMKKLFLTMFKRRKSEKKKGKRKSEFYIKKLYILCTLLKHRGYIAFLFFKNFYFIFLLSFNCVIV